LGRASYINIIDDEMSVSIAAPGPSTVPSLVALADPQPRSVDAAAMDYFLIEAVQTLRHSSAVADARAKKVEDEMIEAGLIPPPPSTQLKSKKDAQRDSFGAGSSAPGDEEEEGVRTRLEAIGYHVGANITERYGDYIPYTDGHRLISKGCAMVGLRFQIPWISLNLSVKTCGQHAGTSRSTTSGQTTGLSFPLGSIFQHIYETFLGRLRFTRQLFQAHCAYVFLGEQG
jgi:hypothetical protein